MCNDLKLITEYSHAASKLLGGKYFILTAPVIIKSSGYPNDFGVYIPAGYLFQEPLIPKLFFRKLFSTSALLMLTYLYETKTALRNGKVMFIEKSSCEILFLDNISKGQVYNPLTFFTKYFLKLIRRFTQPSPTYLLRKNAVEFYLRERYKTDGYYS